MRTVFACQPFVHLARAELAAAFGDAAGRQRELGEAHRLFTEMDRTRIRPASSCDAVICRSRTKARMISTLTAIARGLFRTPESIATPCSVELLSTVHD